MVDDPTEAETGPQTATSPEAETGPLSHLTALAAEERLRLFSWAGNPERLFYLALLRVFDRAHETYRVQQRPHEIISGLADLAEDPTGVAVHTVLSPMPAHEVIIERLDYLVECGLFERSQDAGRVTSVADYKRRRPVYQFTELGYRAWRTLDEVIHSRPGEGQLQRFAFGAIHDDLVALADANRQGDSVRVHRFLYQLDSVFSEMADRAGQFYVMIGQLTQHQEARADIFLDYKDRLIGYLQDFLVELQRFRPLIARAIAEVEATGLDRMMDLVVEADETPFLLPAERTARWQARWDGLVSWFVAPPGSVSAAADELDRTTAAAISELSALLRRIAETRGRGISRSSELTHLARWFWNLEGPDATDDAHGLFAVTFGMSSARHLGALPQEDAEPVAPRVAWSDAPPVRVPPSLREHGRRPSPGPPAPLPDDRGGRELARRRRAEQRLINDRAAARMGTEGLDGRPLDPIEFELLLRLIDRALRSRTPVSGITQVADGSVRLRLRPADHDTLVATTAGNLVLVDLDLTLEPV